MVMHMPPQQALHAGKGVVYMYHTNNLWRLSLGYKGKCLVKTAIYQVKLTIKTVESTFLRLGKASLGV